VVGGFSKVCDLHFALAAPLYSVTLIPLTSFGLTHHLSKMHDMENYFEASA